jgi:Nicotinic acid mononucleotide adenylyltransferase
LVSKYHLLIYPRKGYDVKIPSKLPNVKLVQAPIIEISSSFIRKALEDGKDIRFFLPEAIRNML